MDRVTRNIYNIPQTSIQKEVFDEDGRRYTIETISGEDYGDYSEHSGSLDEGEDGQGQTTDYIITTLKSGSLERRPLKNYRALSATPGRVTGSYSPDDEVYRAELWVPSPDRHSKLEVVRKGELYDLRAYQEEKKPTKLYSEIDEEAPYRTVPVEITPERLRQLEYERKRLIEAQTVKIRPVNRWRSSEDLYSDDGSPPTSLQMIPDISVADLSLSYDTTKSLDKSFSEENVDTEQINFLAARQQFLMLEKNKPDLLQGLKPQSRPPKQSESNRYLYERDWQEENSSPYVLTMTSQLRFDPDDSRQRENYYNATSVPSISEENVRQGTSRIAIVDQDGWRKKGALIHQVPITSSKEDWYPGQGDVDDGHGVGPVSDGSSPREVRAHWQYQENTEQTYDHETPIEREIRLTMEREEELRRERGIQGCTNTSEIVAILKTPVLYRSPPSSPGRKRKDNHCGSYYMQRDIEKEAKREDDLISEGKLIGCYDKGPLEELGERKKRFERQDVVPVLPNQTTYYKSSDFENLQRRASFIPVEIQEQHKPNERILEVSRRTDDQVNRIPTEAYEPYLESTSDGTRTQNVPSSHKILYRNSWHPSSDFDLHPPRLSSEDNMSKADVQDCRGSPKDTFVLQKEYFNWKPWTLRLSPIVAPRVPTEEPPRRTNEIEQALYLENSFTSKPLQTQPLSLIEKEIQEVLQREEELQEQRRMLSLQSGKRDPTSPDYDDPHTRDQETWNQASEIIQNTVYRTAKQKEITGKPDRHVVSLVSTQFRPLVIKTITDETPNAFLQEEQTYPAYSTEQKGPASPPPEWEPKTPGKLKDYQLEEFERRQTGKPDRHVVSLVSSQFRPLVIKTITDESPNAFLQEEQTYPAYRTEQKGPASPPPEWEPKTPGKLKDHQLEEFERRQTGKPDRHVVSLVSTQFRPLVIKTITDETPNAFLQEEQTYPAYSTAQKGPASPPPEWEPKTPGKLKDHQLEEFERRQTGRPDKHFVSFVSTQFRPLNVETITDESPNAFLQDDQSRWAYSTEQKGSASPPLEWEPKTPGKLKDYQLGEFECQRTNRQNQYDEPMRYESAGAVRCHRDLPVQHGVSLFSTPFRPLVVRTAHDESFDSTLMKEPASVTYQDASQRMVSPTSEWERRTPGRLRESQLEEFEGRRNRQREDHGYAGIDPSDDVNNEIVESTRVSRRKSAMALRWEAGQYLNTQDE